ncbi:Cytotoxic [Stigmatella aurantiaca]|uniref:Cytotoxic n=1 Tax=Stigmatella aurantiaca TaxID=41 RepID=A0A1H7XP88_STIAU|nr:colicin E3/pyocin S6 family cytotoxin [Stigmatella aurantiaca]SEM35443.1 Cytotoxic [Stigmatella aurantiaca]
MTWQELMLGSALWWSLAIMGHATLGEFDPSTGKQTQPADPTRRIEP